MNRKLGQKIIAGLICSLFATQAIAQDVDDQTEQQRVFKAAVAVSIPCQALPIDVSQSMVLQNGNPVITNPAGLGGLISDANKKNLLDNCIRSVSNSTEDQIKKDHINDTLAGAFRAAARNFSTAVESLFGRNTNVNIDNKPPIIATIGIRG